MNLEPCGIMDCNNWLCAGYYICFFCFKMFYVDFCYMILNTTKLFLRDYYPVGCGYKVIVYVDAYFRQEWDIIIRVFVQRFHGYFVKEFRVFGNVRMSLRVNSTFFSHTLVHGGSFFFSFMYSALILSGLWGHQNFYVVICICSIICLLIHVLSK